MLKADIQREYLCIYFQSSGHFYSGFLLKVANS
jgi:hypothetical protein